MSNDVKSKGNETTKKYLMITEKIISVIKIQIKMSGKKIFLEKECMVLNASLWNNMLFWTSQDLYCLANRTSQTARLAIFFAEVEKKSVDYQGSWCEFGGKTVV